MDQVFSLILDNPYVPGSPPSWRAGSSSRSSSQVAGSVCPGLAVTSTPGSASCSDGATPIARSTRPSRARRSRQLPRGGPIYEEAQRHQEAVEVYLEGQEFWAAAQSSRSWASSIAPPSCTSRRGDYKKAAQVFIQTGQATRRRPCLFPEKGNTLEAARLFGARRRVGARPRSSTRRAAIRCAPPRPTRRQGEFLKAAECYEKHFMENVSYSTTYSVHRLLRRPEERAPRRAGSTRRPAT